MEHLNDSLSGSAMHFSPLVHSIESMDPRTLIFGSSFACYLAFKHYDPYSVRAHFILLALVPLVVSYITRQHFSTGVIAGATVFASHYALLLTFVTAYRLSPFHPLARYPGPLLNRLTKYKMSRVLAGGKQHIYLQELFHEYGDAVRIGPNEVMLVNAEAVNPVMGSQGLPKGPWYDGRDSGGVRRLIGIRDPVEATRRRKFWHRGFTPAAMEGHEDMIVRHSRRLFDVLDQRNGQILDISEWMGFFSFDFMGEMAFGKPFDLVEKGRDINGYWTLINGGIHLNRFSHIPWIWTYILANPIAGAAAHRLRRFSRSHAEQRIENGSKHRDLFYHLIDEDNIEPEKPSNEQVISDAVLAIIAGSDTTATVLTGLWFCLLQDRDTCRRLQQEIDAYFPDRAEPTDFKKFEHMPFLNACINEAMRLLPPVPSGTQRSTSGGVGGRMICGRFVPDETQILVPTYVLHRDPRYFSPAPEQFWPDRWLAAPERKNYPAPESVEPFVLDTRAFIPFSHGPARCAGKTLAIAEMRAVVCGMLQRYDILPVSGVSYDEWSETVKDFFVMERGALDVVLQQRA